MDHARFCIPAAFRRLIKSAAAVLMLSATSAGAAEDTTQDLQLQLIRLNELRAAIELERSTQGVYSPELLQTLNSLLEALLTTGAFQEAQEAVQEQLQIIRINDGLYSDNQLALILTELEILAAKGDWSSLQERLAYLEWLFPRLSATEPGIRLSAMKQARDWYRLLLLRGPRFMEAQYLLSLRSLESSAVELARSAQLPAAEQTRLLQDLALAEVYVALGMVTPSDTSPQLINHDLGLPTPTNRNITRITSANDLETIYGARTTTVIERAHRAAMSKHQRLINEITDIFGDEVDNNKELAAMLQLQQGDSMLLRQQYELRPGTLAGPARGSANIGSAGTYYAEAWRLLIEAGQETEQLNTLFACPVLLPQNDLLLNLPSERADCILQDDGTLLMSDIAVTRHGIPGLRYENLPDTRLIPSPEGTRATINFSVGVNGQAERIQVQSAEPDSTSARIRGRDALQTLQFRPALRDGRPVRVQQVQMTVFTLEPE